MKTERLIGTLSTLLQREKTTAFRQRTEIVP